MKVHRDFELQEYQSEWKNQFVEIVNTIAPLFGDNLVKIEHIGSTSIEGMIAKPQIDMLVIVKDLDRVADIRDTFIKHGCTSLGRGYVAMDDEYFAKDDANGKRITSIHVLQEGNPKIFAYLAFRDYLRAHPDEMERYASMKRKSYLLHKDNYPEYERGKKDILLEIRERAMHWAENRIGE